MLVIGLMVSQLLNLGIPDCLLVGMSLMAFKVALVATYKEQP